MSSEPVAWTKEKPTVEGAYWVRGWNLDPGGSAENALVTVAIIDCELCSDLNECNTASARDWLPIERHSDSFEWMGPLYAALPELLAAQPGRAAEYDDAASATPTDAEILSSLRGLYASDAAAAMAAEDDVRTVRAFLARRKNYAFPPAAAVPKGVQRDAARYLFLRAQMGFENTDDPDSGAWYSSAFFTEDFVRAPGSPHYDSLDSLIDAAMLAAAPAAKGEAA